jgi:hypothetical protein
MAYRDVLRSNSSGRDGVDSRIEVESWQIRVLSTNVYDLRVRIPSQLDTSRQGVV